jgi:hypothetical protein
MRDDFSEETKRTLAARVNHLCSNPDCRAQTSGPQDDPTKAVNVGVAGHITAAAPGGPRYNPALTSEQRRHPDNGIWVCQTCSHLIDSDVPRFPEDLLRAWKTVAEYQARNSLGKTASESPIEKRLAPELELYLELEKIGPSVYDPRTTPVRSFVLGLRNVGSGTAKFPGISYKRSSGLTVDNYGIDGSFGFGLPRVASDNQWEAFKGGADQVIHPGQTLKITKLLQYGNNKGNDGFPFPKLLGPHGQSVSQWVFNDTVFECEISAEGMQTITVKRVLSEDSVTWPPAVRTISAS